MGERLGQHFLTDRQVLADIVIAAELGSADVVLEIGPGKGILTTELVQRADFVVAVEKDEQLAAELPERLHRPKNLEVLVGDAVQIDLEKEIKNYSGRHAIKIVANIPYEITSPLLFQLFDWKLPLERAVLLMQREVAERLAAPPGRKQRSILSVFGQLWAENEIKQLVPASAFQPPPKVESAVVLLQPHTIDDERRAFLANPTFRRLIKVGFSQKRKQLKNSLAAGFQLPISQVEAWLARADLVITIRAEELKLENWFRLFSTRPSV